MRPNAATTCSTIAFDFGALAQIDGERQAAPALLSCFVRRNIGVALFEIHTSDVTTLRGESRHDRGTKFAVAARDDRCFSFESHCLIEPAASRLLLAERNFFS